MTHRTWRFGLTGGIGSGKSTVAGFLARRGAAIIDADAISRSLTAQVARPWRPSSAPLVTRCSTRTAP